MSKYKHPSRYKGSILQLFPHVCFQCRKSFKKIEMDANYYCVKCNTPLIQLSRKFKVPKSSDKREWNKVQYLVYHGFLFYNAYISEGNGVYSRVRYPKTLNEAKEFVTSSVLNFTPVEVCEINRKIIDSIS